MTEAEWMDLAVQWSSNAISAFTIYVTFTFAYLTAAFFIGERLTRVQMLITSTLYLFSALCGLLACVNGIAFYGAAIGHAPSDMPNYVFSSGEFWLTYVPALLTFGILASLYFMWSVRHPKTN